MSLDPQVRATILAALVHYAQTGQGEPAQRNDLVHELATDRDQQVSGDAVTVAYAFRCIAEAESIRTRYTNPVPPTPAWAQDPAPDWGPVLTEAEAASGSRLDGGPARDTAGRPPSILLAREG